MRTFDSQEYVRSQDGYGAYTLNKTVRELKDMRALVIQEEEAATVKLKHGLPRVYRIRLDVLEDCAEEY